MANRFSYRSGQRNLVKCAVDSASVIEIGDMVWLDTDDVKPASDFVWDTNLATTQASFAAKFAGIAVEKSASGDTDTISVDTSSVAVYEMDAASNTYLVGDMLGPDEVSTTLSDQTLEEAISTSAIARCVERQTAASTKVRVTFAPAYSTNSGNVNANVG